MPASIELAPETRPASILLALHDPEERRRIERALTDADHVPRLVASGHEALRVLRDRRVDLVLVGARLAGIDGTTVCRRLAEQEAGERPPVVLLLDADHEELVLQGLDAGADHCLTVPVALPVLMARIRSLLAGRRRAASDASILDLAPGTLLGDRYEVAARIGRGGMGVVYRVIDRSTRRAVALKILRRTEETDESDRRFRREIASLLRLRHPNIVRLLEAGRHGPHPFYVMENVEGTTLRGRLYGGPLPPPRALEIAASVADALQAVHEAGFVHRDVKPSNVFLPIVGRIKLGDFGIAFPLGRQVPRLTGQGVTIGTPRYLSPEQLAGGPIDARSDVYSLGTVLFEMLTGCLPHEDLDEVEAMRKMVFEEPPLPSEFDPGLPSVTDFLCRCARQRRPEDRFADARSFAHALRAAARR